MTSPSERAPTECPEAHLTIHQDTGNKGRVLFSMDLWSEDRPQEEVIHNCDLIAITLFNLFRVQSKAFNDTYLQVVACISEMAAAQAEGKSPQELAAIRETYGIVFRAE